MAPLTVSDIERMKSITVLSSQIPPKESQRRELLKEICHERVSKWKNTLAAQHASRLEWKARKKEEKERRWLEIDREEAEIQEKIRLDTIERAKTLLNEQRERVRFLRSQQMYQEVLETRKHQIEQIRQKKAEMEKIEAQLHQQAISKAKKEEEQEQEVIKLRNMQAKELSRKMKASMEKLKEEKRERKEKQKNIEAEEIRKFEKEDSEMRLQAQSDKVKALNEAKLDFIKIKQTRIDEQEAGLKKEEEENQRREREVTKMIETKQSRILLERKHFETAEANKKLFYHKASQMLEQRLAAEKERLEKEVLEIEVKQKNQEDSLGKSKREMNDSLHKSRREQIAEKARLKAEEDAREKIYTEHILKTDMEGKEQLKRDAVMRQQAKINLHKQQEEQILEFKERKDKLKMQEIELKKQCSDWTTECDAEFCQFAAKEIERLRSLGKETALLERTLRISAAKSESKTKNTAINSVVNLID